MMPAADDNGDIRARVNSLEHADAAIISRLNTLEQWQRSSEIADARKDEQWKHVDNRFNELDKKIGNVNGTLLKLLWLFASAFVSATIVAVVAFVVNGGLKVS